MLSTCRLPRSASCAVLASRAQLARRRPRVAHQAPSLQAMASPYAPNAMVENTRTRAERPRAKRVPEGASVLQARQLFCRVWSGRTRAHLGSHTLTIVPRAPRARPAPLASPLQLRVPPGPSPTRRARASANHAFTANISRARASQAAPFAAQATIRPTSSRVSHARSANFARAACPPACAARCRTARRWHGALHKRTTACARLVAT